MKKSKAILFVHRTAPHGTIHALESLDMVLISSAFDQVVSMAFVDDGVYQLKNKQNTSEIAMKDFSVTFGALADYGVTKLYIDKDSLEERGLCLTDLLNLTHEEQENEEISSLQLVTRSELAHIMEQQDVLFSA